jgi:SAM-dependent methyltransferase
MGGYRAIPEFYDPENESKEMLRHDVPFLLTHLPRKRQQILELAVGTGRAAIPLAQARHSVVGVDHDPRVLDIARRKRDSVGLTENDLRLVEGDMLSLDLGERFDWVVLLFNTFLVFTTLEQQDAALRRMIAHLSPRGRIWLDVFHPHFEILAHDRATGRDPTLFYVPSLGRTVHRTTELRPDSARQVQRVTFHYQWHDDVGRPRTAKTRFELALLFPVQFRMLLERNGLEVEHFYGDYDGSELTSDSPRMIVCCRPGRRGGR